MSNISFTDCANNDLKRPQTAATFLSCLRHSKTVYRLHSTGFGSATRFFGAVSLENAADASMTRARIGSDTASNLRAMESKWPPMLLLAASCY